MFLRTLKEYAEERLSLPPSLYVETPIGYVVELDVDGQPRTSHLASLADQSDPKSRRGMRMLAPNIVRASGIRPLLLADQSEYTFGMARDPAKQKRVDEAHAAYRELLDACAAATAEPAVIAIRRFYEAGGARLLTFDDSFDAGLKVTFRVYTGLDSLFPIDLPSVQSFWAGWNDPEAAGAVRMQCIVCGQVRPVLDRLQGKVKGIRGGQTAGTSIIAANAEAFESYGLKASLIAPTCQECGEHFTNGINALIREEETHLDVANSTFIFWERSEQAKTGIVSLLTAPTTATVRRLIDSGRSGERPGSYDKEQFFAAALSASGGRAVVRDWIDTTVGDLEQQLAGWFSRQTIVGRNGEPGRPLGIYALAGATVRTLDDLPVTTPRSLLHAAFTGSALPMSLLYEAVRRNRAEQQVTHNRAALIKLVLLSQPDIEPHSEDFMTGLEPDHPSVAYHCGRLLAVIEKVQRRAMPGVNATVVDRFFGTASSAPASVFGRLLRGAQPHLSKLERDNRGAFVNLQREIEGVTHHIPAFPTTLALEEQGLFALGYYHQRAQRAVRSSGPTDAAAATQQGEETDA